jgi:hypothetical protein
MFQQPHTPGLILPARAQCVDCVCKGTTFLSGRALVPVFISLSLTLVKRI